MTDFVYHYCSLDGFINIMKNKSLWLSDVRKSNDSDECMYLFKHLKVLIKNSNEANDFIKKLALKYVKAYEAQYEYSSLEKPYKRNAELSNIQIPYDQIPIVDSKVPSVHAICFSEAPDLLSQWRGYAEDGTGIAIGFRTHFLGGDSGMFMIRDDEGYHRCANFDAVNYDDNAVFELTECKSPLIMKLCSDEIQLDGNQFEMKELIDGAINEYLNQLEFQSITHKSSGFAEEREHRIFITDPLDFIGGYPPKMFAKHPINKKDEDKLERHCFFNLSELKFRAKNCDIVSYYELFFNKIMDDFIAEINIGPKCKARTSDIEFMLKNFGYKNVDGIYIHRSRLSYR